MPTKKFAVPAVPSPAHVPQAIADDAHAAGREAAGGDRAAGVVTDELVADEDPPESPRRAVSLDHAVLAGREHGEERGRVLHPVVHELDPVRAVGALGLLRAVAPCDPAATCDYGGDTHSYDCDPGIAFPADPWRSLPGVEIDDPDDLPID